MQGRSTKLIVVAEILLDAYYAWYFLPCGRAFFDGGVFKSLFFGCFALGLALLFLNYVKIVGWRFKARFNILAPILAFMAALLLMAAVNYGEAGTQVRVVFSCFGSAFVYYLTAYAPRTRLRLVKFLLALLAITYVTSLAGLIVDPDAGRKLTFSLEDDDVQLELARRNVGGIYLYQLLVLFVPILVRFIKNNVQRVKAAFFLLCVVIIIVQASFTISFMMLTLGTALAAFDIKRLEVKIAICLASGFLAFAPWDDVGAEFAAIIPNERIAKKFADAATSAADGEAVGSTQSRADQYMTSLRTAITRPWGVGPCYFENPDKYGVGVHSQILDDWARYGVFGLAFHLVFLCEYFKLLKKQWGLIRMEEVAFPVVAVLGGFFLLNLAFRSSQESVALFLLLPILPELIIDANRKNVGDFLR